MIPYNPIAGGLLTGKHRRDRGPTAGTRFTLGNAAERYQDRYWHEREFETVEALRPLAAEAGHAARAARGGVGAGRTRRSPRRSSARAAPSSSTTCCAAAEKPLDAALKARLDELTREYRWGDDAR